MRNISIIIPVLNESLVLDNTLSLIKDQAYNKEIEIIIAIASQTTDGSLNIAQKHKCLAVMCDVNSRAMQMNKGAAVASGDVLLFLHADTIPPKSFDKYIIKALNSGYDAGFFSYKFSKAKGFLKINQWFTQWDGLHAGGGDQGIFIKKSTFNQIGAYSERYVIMEDFDLIRRIRKKKIGYTIIKQPLTVSSRKYRSNNYLKVNIINLIALLKFRMGHCPTKIKSFYTKYIN